MGAEYTIVQSQVLVPVTGQVVVAAGGPGEIADAYSSQLETPGTQASGTMNLRVPEMVVVDVKVMSVLNDSVPDVMICESSTVAAGQLSPSVKAAAVSQDDVI